MIDHSPIYNSLLQLYINENDCLKARDLLGILEEANIVPDSTFFNKWELFLKRNGEPIPLGMDKKKVSNY